MMTDSLTAADFPEFFRSVHGYEPYRWQVRLTEQVLGEGCWPDVIDLPTGTGKTAVLDTAVFSLAARPDLFPRRVVFVIDRRIVVDQVFERAERISDAVKGGESDVLVRMREALNQIAPDADDPIGVSALRGGIPIDNDWATRPDKPWVMVSTVDQFGSKLLFRGYGIRPGMRPIHAGLAGNDCLIILDEVHLNRAFADTLRDLDEQPSVNSFAEELLPRRSCVVEMSATPPDTAREIFRLDPETDLGGEGEACRRLNQIARAPKRARLVPVVGEDRHAALSNAIALIAKCELLEYERSIGVVVNRVRTAREVHQDLVAAGHDARLITGRMRPLDREGRLGEIAKSVDPDRRDSEGDRTFVVATQSIEVGADFSFDALVTEACPLDSLRQRVGRLDRRGALAQATGKPARCWVLGLKSEIEGKKLRPDPIYGNAVLATWRALDELAEDGQVDVSSTSQKLRSITAGDVTAPSPQAPLLLASHIEAFAQTSPEPIVQPILSDFLHGYVENPPEPEVSIVWRWDRSPVALRLVPPRQAEKLSVPISAAKAWLRGNDEVPVADVAAPPVPASRDSDRPPSSAAGLRRYVGGAANSELVARLGDIEPGDVLVVDPAFGGLADGSWAPQEVGAASAESGGNTEAPAKVTAVHDLGDEAQWAYRRRATIRLDAQLDRWIRAWLGDASPAFPWPVADDQSEDVVADESRSLPERVSEWFEQLLQAGAEEVPSHLRWLVGSSPNTSGESSAALRHLKHHPYVIELVSGSVDDDDADTVPQNQRDYYVLAERSVDAWTLGTDDDASMTGAETTLSAHLGGVGVLARRFALGLGLSDDLCDDLQLAGELHDLGKVDQRFQAQMAGHDLVRMAMLDEPLAKSLPGARTCRRRWPPIRHEFSSVALAQSWEQLAERAHDPDLVLHLVGSHHGNGRPLPRLIPDPCPQVLEYEFEGAKLRTDSDLCATPLALEMADRFWRLSEKYGHHGLAWLEAILRLADHRRSEQEAAK